MTKENQKKLYEHFIKTNQSDRAKEILIVYPEFEVKEIKEEVKSKKEK